MTKHVLCCNKSMLVTTTFLSKLCLSQQNFCCDKHLLRQAYFSCNKRCVLWWQTHVCHDRSILVVTKLLSQQNYVCHDKYLAQFGSVLSQQTYFLQQNFCLSWQKIVWWCWNYSILQLVWWCWNCSMSELVSWCWIIPYQSLFGDCWNYSMSELVSWCWHCSMSELVWWLLELFHVRACLMMLALFHVRACLVMLEVGFLKLCGLGTLSTHYYYSMSELVWW